MADYCYSAKFCERKLQVATDWEANLRTLTKNTEKDADFLRRGSSWKVREVRGKTIDITGVVKFPDTVPEGKEILQEGKAVGNYQTALFAKSLV